MGHLPEFFIAQLDFRVGQFPETIEGKFLLSLNDCEGVRDTFGAFTFEELSPTYTAGTRSAKGR